MVQPMTSGPSAFWNDRNDRREGELHEAPPPTRPSVPRPVYRAVASASALALRRPADFPVAARRLPAETTRRRRARPRRVVPLSVYWWRAKAILAAAVLVGAATVAGQRLWRAVLGPAPSPAVLVPLTVRSGDSLWSLARRYGDPNVSILDRVDTLARANGLSSTSSLTPGQRLVVPVMNPAAEVSRRDAEGAEGF